MTKRVMGSVRAELLKMKHTLVKEKLSETFMKTQNY